MKLRPKILAINQVCNESFIHRLRCAYELLTNKEVWGNLKLPNAKVTVEKSQS